MTPPAVSGTELPSPLRALVGRSMVMERLRTLVRRTAPLQLATLVQGPTGSGKELVASALHALSGRRGRFVSFNACAIPDTMFEDALFGHVRGAFTGATHDAPGYLLEADQGTVFFDEIGSLPLQAQAKLLRAIDSQEFRAVGATHDRRSEFRVVAATNESIDVLVRANRFRLDLMHRLTGMIITVPPLTERLEDIPELVTHFLARSASGTATVMSDRALAVLESYEWPGNVRELRQVVDRARALSTAALIGADVVIEALEFAHANGDRPGRRAGENGVGFAQALLAALDAAGGDTATVAHHFDVDRSTVYRWLEQLGIATPRRRRVSMEGPVQP